MGYSDSTISRFLTLLRASLWDVPAESIQFSDGETDWDSIIELAMHQTVAALVINGAMSLTKESLPPRDWINRGIYFLEQNRRTHLLLDNCVAESVATLRNSGIGSVLLKGQAYARYYPNPTLRQCGDIDLYVGGSDFYKAYQVACGAGWKSDERFVPQGKHYGCYLKNVHLELHRIAAQLISPKRDRFFQKWSREELSTNLFGYFIGNERITTPSPLFDVLFVFSHLYYHFILGGIGLRHICDWAMILHTHHGKYSHQELEQLLKTFGLMKGWHILVPMLTGYLHLPESECPFLMSKYTKKSNKVFSIIIKEGNFGRHLRTDSIPPKNYLLRKTYSLLKLTGKMIARFPIAPTYVMKAYCRYVISAIKRVVGDMKNKR